MFLLGQVEQVTTSGLSDFAGKFGFPALLVLVLLYGIYKMLDASRTEREKRDERDEKREEARRGEREADRKAHVDALAGNTAAIGALGNAVMDMGRKLEILVGDVHDQSLRIAKGG